MTNLKKILRAVIVGATTLGLASPVIASTLITITDTTITVSCTQVTPTSDPVCGGIVDGALTVSGNEVTGGDAGVIVYDFADLYDIGNNSVENEAQALDILIDGLDDDDFIGADGTQTDAFGVDSLSFNSTAAYIAFKIGAGHFFLSLVAPGDVTIAFDKNGQQKGGFSHYTEFGVSAIPVPAAAWLFGTALIGFIGFSRRTKV